RRGHRRHPPPDRRGPAAHHGRAPPCPGHGPEEGRALRQRHRRRGGKGRRRARTGRSICTGGLDRPTPPQEVDRYGRVTDRGGRMTLADETRWLDATAQAELVRGGAVSPAELVEAAVERIEALDGPLNAVVIRWFDDA